MMNEPIHLDTDLGRAQLLFAMEVDDAKWQISLMYQWGQVTFWDIHESMMVHKLGLYPSVFGGFGYSYKPQQAKEAS